MSRHDDSVPMRHMLDHAREAVEMAQGRERLELDDDRQFNLAMTRLVEIIGEAARRVSSPTRQNHAQVPWSQIVGTRDRLIHGYDRVDFDILWKIVHDELPPLIDQLETILADKGKSEA